MGIVLTNQLEKEISISESSGLQSQNIQRVKKTKREKTNVTATLQQKKTREKSHHNSSRQFSSPVPLTSSNHVNIFEEDSRPDLLMSSALGAGEEASCVSSQKGKKRKRDKANVIDIGSSAATFPQEKTIEKSRHDSSRQYSSPVPLTSPHQECNTATDYATFDVRFLVSS